MGIKIRRCSVHCRRRRRRSVQFCTTAALLWHGRNKNNDICSNVLSGNKNDLNITSSNIGAVVTLLLLHARAVKDRRSWQHIAPLLTLVNLFSGHCCRLLRMWLLSKDVSVAASRYCYPLALCWRLVVLLLGVAVGASCIVGLWRCCCYRVI